MTTTELHDMQVVSALESTVRQSEWRRGKVAATDLPRCKTVCQSATAQLEHIYFEPILRLMDGSIHLSITKVNSDGDVYAINTTAYAGSNYRLLIRFFEIEAIASDLENAL